MASGLEVGEEASATAHLLDPVEDARESAGLVEEAGRGMIALGAVAAAVGAVGIEDTAIVLLEAAPAEDMVLEARGSGFQAAAAASPAPAPTPALAPAKAGPVDKTTLPAKTDPNENSMIIVALMLMVLEEEEEEAMMTTIKKQDIKLLFSHPFL